MDVHVAEAGARLQERRKNLKQDSRDSRQKASLMWLLPTKNLRKRRGQSLSSRAAFCPQEEQLKQVEAKMDAYYKFVLAHSDSAKQRLLASVPGLPTGRGSASFLASKVMPVDGFKIRNSLFLTVRCPVCACCDRD